MAVFYFSTGGDLWNLCDRSDSSCGDVFPFVGQEPYLSSSNECEWAGTECDSDLCVTSIEFELNNLNGTIPYELEQLGNLNELILEQGSLSGTIPTQLGRLSDLAFFDLDFNELSGTVPEQIYDLTELQILDLNNNKLTGTLSNKIGNLEQLTLLQLYTNQFEGTIPQSISNLLNLVTADFYSNDFTGSVPIEMCDISTLNFLSSDCAINPDTGVAQVNCTCCTGCGASKNKQGEDVSSDTTDKPSRSRR